MEEVVLYVKLFWSSLDFKLMARVFFCIGVPLISFLMLLMHLGIGDVDSDPGGSAGH